MCATLDDAQLLMTYTIIAKCSDIAITHCLCALLLIDTEGNENKFYSVVSKIVHRYAFQYQHIYI